MSELTRIGWVFLGAGCGGTLRYLVQSACNRRYPEFPWGTFAINIIGSLLIGIYFGWEASQPKADVARFLIPTGLLGGFTTFSAFSAEANRLFTAGDRNLAILYIGGSVLLSLVACYMGLRFGELWFR